MMDYKDKYKDLIATAKASKRDKGGDVYYESHHIVPDFMFKNRKRNGPYGHLDGNPDASSNLVLLTFREHLLAHYLLFKILEHTHYAYSAGSALQFFFIHHTNDHVRSKEYDSLSEEDFLFMEKCREIGVASISKHRSGMMPAKCATTGESVGSVPIDHENVISGKWVHITKGLVRPNCGRPMDGDKNTNYRVFSDTDKIRAFNCIRNSVDSEGYFRKKLFDAELRKEFVEYPKISHKWVVSRFDDIQNMIYQFNISTNSNVLYDPYHRSLEQRSVLAKKSSSIRKLTSIDGMKTIKMQQDLIPQFLMDNLEFNTEHNKRKCND